VKRKRGAGTEIEIDVSRVAGGKVDLSVSDTEILVIQLLIEGYLTAQVQQTKYATYAYLIPSPTASRLTRYAREDLTNPDHSIWCHFAVKVRKPAKGKKRAVPVEEGPLPQDTATTSGAKPSYPTKRKREEVDDPKDDESVIEISSDAMYEDDEILEAGPPPRSRGSGNPLDADTRKVDSDSEELYFPDSEDDGVWTYSHRPHTRQRRRTKSPATMADLSDF